MEIKINGKMNYKKATNDIRILAKAFYFLKHLRSFWTFQKKTVLIKNVIALLFSALTAMVSRSAAMRMT